MAKKSTELKQGAKVYAEPQEQNGVIESIEKAKDGSDTLIYVVRLANDEVRRYTAEMLGEPVGNPKKEKEEEEEQD